MDAQQFLAEFGHIASAPDGVQRLREMILALAVQGRLISESRRPSGPTARELVDSIARQKLKLVKAKQIGKQSTYSAIDVAACPFSLPNGWVYVRLGEITSKIGSGSTPRGGREVYVSEGVPFLRSQNVWNDGLRLTDVAFISSDEHARMANSAVLPNDILLNITGASLGRCSLVPNSFGEANVSQHVTIIRLTNPELRHYLHLCILSPIVQKMIWDRQVGMAREGLSKKVLEQFEIPLPPLEEQACIVAKVDELMALCDKLEAQQQERSRMELASRKAVLGDLINADTVSFSLARERLDRNLGNLFVTPEAIDDFATSLKDLAVRGLLTPTTDMLPDVAAITQSCTSLRNKYIAAQWMRKQKLILVSDSAVEYPSNWQVLPFDEVAVVIGGVTKGRDLRGREVITCPYLSVANVQRGFFKLEGIKTIEIAAEELGKYGLEDGDLMITEGGDWDKVGRTAIWRGGIENCLHQNHVFKARVPSDHLLNEWVELVFNSNVGRDYFAGASKQTTNLASINMTQLRSFPLPIPPLVEQKAILEKLSTMSSACKTWRGQREQAQKLSALLASASVSAITGVRFEEEEEELKAPKTELISNLRLGESPNIKEQAPLAAILARQNGEMHAKDLWQRFGGEIDVFYAQLKLEVNKGWIREPEEAVMRIQEGA